MRGRLKICAVIVALLLSPLGWGLAPSYGATKFLETPDATRGTQFWSSVTGAVTYDSATTPKSGVASWKMDNAGDATAYLTKTGILGANGRVAAYIRFTAFDATTRPNIEIASSGGTIIFEICTSTAGVISLHVANCTGSQIGSDGATLSVNTWYHFAISWSITSTTVYSVKIFIDGVESISGSNSPTLGSASPDKVSFGFLLTDTGGQFFNLQHVYVDDGSGVNYPGDVRITAKRPNANGTAVEFTTQIGAGGSGYGSGHSPQVNERPLSETNGWSFSNTTRKTEEYNIEDAATGDVDLTGATIIDWMGWAWSNVNSTANSPVHRIITAGTLTAITESTTAQMFTHIQGSSTYPPGTGADIGIDAQYTTTAHLTRLFESGVIVAYIPAVAGAGPNFFPRRINRGGP
jgi:predicted enzyme related to lactoylglutathione lyase